MSVAEQSTRMRVLRANVATFNASWWASQLLHDALLESRRGHATMIRQGSRAERMSA
jgi:trehalose-6-phosphate synthase